MKQILPLCLWVGVGAALGQSLPTDSLKANKNNYQPPLSGIYPQLTPKSPNSAAFEKYGQYEVSLYNGLPTIEIPLHEFKVGNVNVPIKLTYHASGIKVTDQATWVGMGWTLHTGGSLTRMVQGRADEQALTHRSKIITPYESRSVTCVNAQIESDFNQLLNNITDAQRDLFAYQHPTGSNTFIITPYGQLKLQAENSKVQCTTAGSGTTVTFDQFEVTDEQGSRYVFSAKETTSGAGYGYISAWHLTQINGANPVDKAIYTYQSYTPTYIVPDEVHSGYINEELYRSAPPTSGFPVETGVARYFENVNVAPGVTTTVPTSILYPGGRVNFIVNNTLQANGQPSLDRIEIYGVTSTGSYSLIKAFGLEYVSKTRTADSRTGALSSPLSDLFLNRVLLLNSALQTIGTYSLDYNSTQLPAVTSYAKDYWGYFNGQPNSNLIPQQTYQSSTGAVTIGLANREPDEASMQARVLTKITFPTGGLTQFEYETNRYRENNVTKLAGGLRIKAIRSFTAPNQSAFVKTYRYGINESNVGTFRSSVVSTRPSSRYEVNYYDPSPAFGDDFSYRYRQNVFSSSPTFPLTPNEGSPVTYPQVTEYNDANGQQGKTVYTFKDDVDDNVVYATSESFKFASISRHWGRGQLLRKNVFSSTGQILQRTINTYGSYGEGVDTTFMGLIIHKYLVEINFRVESNTSPFCYQTTNGSTNIFYFTQPYYFSFGTLKLIQSSLYEFNQVDTTRYTLRTTQTDYSLRHYQPTQTRTFVEGIGTLNQTFLGTRYSYPQDFTYPIGASADIELLGIKTLQAQNIYRSVETINFRQEPNKDRIHTTGQLTTYRPVTVNGGTIALPYQVYTTETDFNNKVTQTGSSTGLYAPSAQMYNLLAPNNPNSFPIDFVWQNPRLTMNSYDAQGNLTSYSMAAGATTTYSYATQAPNGISFSYVTSETKNALQPSAQTTTFGYAIPILGVSTVTDPRNVATTYEYDNFGRLVRVRDKDGNILKQLTYHYSTATAQP